MQPQKHLPSFTQLSVNTFALAGILILVGCDRATPTTYQIPKEDRSVTVPTMPTDSSERPEAASAPSEESIDPVVSEKSQTASNGMQVLPGMSEAADAAGQIDYEIPENWTEIPATGIRKANFTVEDEGGKAEITVLVFPGDVGGTLENINRWRGQIGLGPIDFEQVEEVAEPYVITNHGALLVRLLGTEKGITGGILPFHGFTWFFKMQGDIATVVENEENMRAFLDSVQLNDPHH